VGHDISGEMVEQARRLHPEHTFLELSGERAGELDETFDYVLLSNVLTEVMDVRRFLCALRPVMSAETRVVIVGTNFLWEPALQVGGRLGLRPRGPAQNWFSPGDYRTLLHAADLEVVRQGSATLLPKKIPLLSPLINDLAGAVPGLNRLGLLQYFVARPEPAGEEALSVSVVVPCKDEEENIEGLVARIPELGRGTEIIFVDDRSSDGTAAKVREEIERHPQRKIRLVEGPGRGKGAAVRAGLETATGDVLMILDADMTVMPEVLPDFLDLISSGKAEFVNGSRMVYPMQEGAMRFANVVGNKLFATLFTFILEQPIKDTLCGTKVVRRRDYAKLLEAREEFGEVDLWGDYDWIFGAARHHLKIVELPVHYVARTAGETKMNRRLRNATIMLRMSVHGLKGLKLSPPG
jgi:GT2 family glycosyltransferase